MSKIIPIVEQKIDPAEEMQNSSGDRDQAMLKGMLQYARSKPQHGLIPLETHKSTRNTKLVLLMIPEWGVAFPPYNLSRLAGVTKNAGYDTTIFDVNVKAWRALQGRTDFDFWNSDKTFYWASNELYFNNIHPLIEPILNDFLDKIVKIKPAVVGFSLYYTNEWPTNWMASKIRELLPDCKILVGGPQSLMMMPGTANYYDYIVQGEGEQILLDILQGIEEGVPLPDKIIRSKDRLNLDSFPFPDYTQYDFSDYQMPNGMSTEVSRGCIAQCTFCNEVNYWKYRGRQSLKILDEIESQYKTYGLDFVWFVDSLVNGNLKELRAFALGVIERKLPITWQGYSRCDGRMDLAYLTDLANSGCHLLNYGIESGSQNVLNLMKKGTNVTAIENNLRDGASVGINHQSTWILGYPGETSQDVSETFTLVWRIRNYNNSCISPGMSLMMTPGAKLQFGSEEFNVSGCHYLQAWFTNDFLNTKLHRLIRQKSFLIFLQHLNFTRGNKNHIDGFDRPELCKWFTTKYDINNIADSIEYEQFDYNIIKFGEGTSGNEYNFKSTVVNEIWPLLRTLWRALGPYSINVKFDPKADSLEWGPNLECDFTADINFTIDENGDWQSTHYLNFVQTAELPEIPYVWNFNYSFALNWSGNGNWYR